MADPATLVSVIVRTMGRPYLAEALSSIAAQRYGHVEVVLVDASGRGLDLPSGTCGPFPLLRVGGRVPLSRPAAANAGLAAARGDLLTFLDEDDLLDPHHLAGLVDALQARTDCVAAYSKAREVDRHGRHLRTRERQFSRFLLFSECFVVICSVLFRRSVLASCRFDESFDVFEDWDFWLQVSRLGPFLFVPQETAIYRTQHGTSGLGDASQRDFDHVKPLLSRLAAKWSGEAGAMGRALDAEFSRALDLVHGRSIEAAAKAVDGILAQYPYHAGALGLRGNLFAASGQFEPALADFLAAAREDPAEPAHLMGAAQALERLGRPHEAISCYERAQRLAPRSAAIAARLSKLQSPTPT